MYLIEKISNSIGNKLSSALNLDKDNRDIIAYGAFTLIQTLLSISLTVLFGVLFDVLIESLIISFSSAILRKYSGGAHASSPNRCTLIGVLLFGLLSIISSKVPISYIFLSIFIFLNFLFSYLVIYKYAPMDNPNKPIRKEEIRKKLKKACLNLLTLYLILSLILFTFYFKLNNSNILVYILCIQLGTLSQSITLINIGNLIISKLDYIFENIGI